MPKKLREPADPSDGPVAAFGFELRTLRQRACQTYTAIAQNSYFSKSAIHAVDQGHQLPSESKLKAFVKACGEDPAPWLERRAELAAAMALNKEEAPEKSSMRDRDLPFPDPATVTTPLEFNDGLKRLREWSGLTYRQIADTSSEGGTRVAPSTLCGAVTRSTLPRRDLVAGFLQAIGLPQPGQQAWLDTWQAIKDGQPVRPARPQVLPTVHDVLGTPPADAIASYPWDTPAPTHLEIQSSPPPEHLDLGLTPARVPDNDVVVPTYLLPTSEIRDWTFDNGRWQTVEGPDPTRSRRIRVTAWLLAITIAVAFSATMTILGLAITSQ